MIKLRDQLIENYADHYTRVNDHIDPRRLAPSRARHMKLMYHEFVSRLPQGSRVLDLGCGSGMLVSWLSAYPNLEPEGVDESVSQIRVARQALPNTRIACRDGLQFLREHPETFHGIFCTDVLEHIPGKDRCFEWVASARAALVPGGFFLCRMPNAASLLGSYSRYRDLTHECSFTSTSVLQLLESAGLDNCRIVPIRVASLGGRARQSVEAAVHRIAFRICGEVMEDTFTTNVCGVGFRSE